MNASDPRSQNPIQRLAGAALALVMTLSTFGGIDQLARQDVQHGVQAQAVEAPARGGIA
jgi:hypothetical protein